MPSLRACVLRSLLRAVVRPLFLRGNVADWRRRWPSSWRPAGMHVQPIESGPVRAEWLIPPDAERTVIYYLHGGGFVMGSPGTHRRMMSHLARAARSRAFVLDYRLAPEHPFPAALDDSVAGYRWLLAHGVPPSEIVIAGDSAGGTLTLATLVVLRDAGDPLPAGAVCVSAATDLTRSGASHRTRVADEVLLSPRFLRVVDALYRGHVDARDPLASPLFAELGGLPPLLMHVGSHELLLDDTLAFAAKARAAGVDVTLDVWPGLWHVFHAFVSLPEARRALDQIAAFARRRFASSEVATARASQTVGP
ncbi:MAG: hydrolase or acyltransferase, alpha/beta fold family [bacterium]|nr:hydrolase or acyltransferase, alpha/beta fold family [bacterium]